MIHTDTITDPRATYVSQGLDQLADTELVAAMATRLTVPRHDPADSFVLHAPLELVARAALLPFVQPDQRARARLRLVSLATGFEASGPPMDARAGEPTELPSVAAAAARLTAALDRGELDDIDAAAAWLGRTATPVELRHVLADAVLPRLAAAAHAPIFLYHLPRVAPRGEVTGELLRGLARELGRQPAWRLHWIEERDAHASAAHTTSPDDLFAAIAATPRLGQPADTFIFPLMSYVDSQGIAGPLLDAVTRPSGQPGDAAEVAARGRAVLRAAAWTMLLEPGDHAPYGWSHALTMPQAVLGVAGALTDPSLALAVAATYVVGFRSALAREPLVAVEPAPVAVPWREALDEDPPTAAAAVWHVPEAERRAVAGALATRASVQHDAHLVKYTLACLDAAADDPGAARLFLAAAASLVAWWGAVDNPDDPLR